MEGGRWLEASGARLVEQEGTRVAASKHRRSRLAGTRVKAQASGCSGNGEELAVESSEGENDAGHG